MIMVDENQKSSTLSGVFTEAEYRTDVSRSLAALAHTAIRAHEADRAIGLLNEAFQEMGQVPPS